VLRLVPALACAVTLAAPGCGDDGGRGPGLPEQGPPAARHGAGPVAVYERVERSRLSLAAAAELNRVSIKPDAPPRRFRSRLPDVRFHLSVARRTYRPLAARVRRADPELGREIDAAFAEMQGMLGSRPQAPELGRRLGQVSGQLFDAVVLELVPEEPRLDPGVRAQIVSDMTRLLVRRYPRGLAAGSAARRAFQAAWGAITRAAQLSRGISDTLGPQRDDVLDALLDLREDAFPIGIFRPPPPHRPGRVIETTAEVRAALRQRYGLRR
jgi:hypothetical protein